VDPLLLQGAFRIGFLILILALAILPFQDPAKPEFVATVLALIVGLVFVLLVTFLARSTLPPRGSGRQDGTQSTKRR
jgi:hypothetical protein